MKKTQYMKPQTIIVMVKTKRHLLINSIDREHNATFDVSSMTEGDGSDAASRGGLWDDDDYDNDY